MASPIWKAFELVNDGSLRQILSEKSVPEEVIDALVDIVAREEHRLTKLIRGRKRK